MQAAQALDALEERFGSPAAQKYHCRVSLAFFRRGDDVITGQFSRVYQTVASLSVSDDDQAALCFAPLLVVEAVDAVSIFPV